MRPLKSLLIGCICLSIVLFSSCGNSDYVEEEEHALVETLINNEAPLFDEESAFSYIQNQIDFGYRIPGTAAHSWQAVASGGTEIGTKGMLVASKTMALTAIDLMSKPELIKKATEEFNKSIGDYKYKALLGDIKPALNYRD